MSRRRPAGVLPAIVNGRDHTTPSDADDPAAEWSRGSLQVHTFAHPHLRRTVDEVTSALIRPGGPQIVAVAGPTGVGKSTARRLVGNVLAHGWRQDMEADPNLVPIVFTEAPPARGREFPWRQFVLRLLGGLGDPAVDRLVGANLIGGAPPGRAAIGGTLSTDDLLLIATQRFVRRGVRVVLIDEAQQIAAVQDALDLRRNLDILKSFSNETGVRIALFGTYEVLKCARASAQLNRRTVEVHFPRYRWKVKHEKAAFERVAREMAGTIEGLDEPAIAASIDALFERTLGCVGTLHSALLSAEDEFRRGSGITPWTDCLRRAVKPVGGAIAMLDEIEETEAELAESDSARAVLRSRLGLPPLDARPGTPPPPVAASASPGNRRTRRPGRRSPKRDPVGSDG